MKEVGACMAMYHMHVQVISRGQGRSAVAAAAYRSDESNRNPHVHMMLTMRPCDESGFTAKFKSAYLVRDARGNERMADAAEFRELKQRAYEKVYTYRSGGDYQRLTPSQAESMHGYRRVSKNPVKLQVPMAAWLDYRDDTQIRDWRAKLADVQNRFLAEYGHDARVDHRSYEDRGIDRVSQVHEGPNIRAMERKVRNEALRRGVEYEPVTSKRRETIEIQRINDTMEQASEAVAALEAKIAKAKETETE